MLIAVFIKKMSDEILSRPFGFLFDTKKKRLMGRGRETGEAGLIYVAEGSMIMAMDIGNLRFDGHFDAFNTIKKQKPQLSVKPISIPDLGELCTGIEAI